MLKINDLTKEYRTKKGYVTKALRGVTVDFPERGLVFMLGKSGSGKSTLLNVIGGLDAPSGGEIVVNGKSSKDFTPSDFDSYRNTYVGFVFQEYNLIPEYSVGANVALALELQGRASDKAYIEKILRSVDLVDAQGATLFDRRTNELSGGQKQRVAIARALVKDPEIILADEPTGALDSKTGTQLYELLKSLARDKLVIVVTHDRESAEKYGDRIIELADGKIIADSASSAVLSACAEEKEQCRFIKSKLPFTRTLAMGASGLKTKKFRLILSIFLSVVAFAIFGFAFTASRTDVYTVELKTLADNEMHMLAVNATLTGDDGENFIPLTTKQTAKLTEYNDGRAPVALFTPSAYGVELDEINEYVGETGLDNRYANAFYSLGLGRFSYLAELDPQTGTDDARLAPDARFLNAAVCRLPETDEEIAITDIRASMFIRFGYRDENGDVEQISTPDDLIGRKLGEFSICGVYSTEIDTEIFGQYADRTYVTDETNFFYGLANGAQNSVLTYGFVREGFLVRRQSDAAPQAVLLDLSGDFVRDRALLDALNYSADGKTYSVNLQSAVSELVSLASMFKADLLLPFMICAAVFSVFAALLMMNFLTVTLDFKKRELGILRALGARRKDVLNICLVESLIIAAIEFALSLIVVCFACLIVNKINFVALFNVGFLEVLTMLLLCFGVAALATVIPVTRITGKKPVDIISNK